MDQQVREFFSKQACDEWLKANFGQIRVVSLTVITPSFNPNNGSFVKEHVAKYVLTYEDRT